MTPVVWVDATAGVAGDMLLGALHGLGVLDDLPQIVADLPGLQARIEFADVARSGLQAVSARVDAGADQPERRLAEVLAVISACPVDPAVQDRAGAVFRRLADAEAAVHGVPVDDVHFHEVGAVDAVVDVLGACLGLHRLAPAAVVVSPIGLGGGSADTRHGRVPVPVPAVLELLSGSELTGSGGPGTSETATPTGVAVLAEWATAAGVLPAMQVRGVGVGAGRRDPASHPNVLRLVTGDATPSVAEASQWAVVEANVDDLDPRLWPTALQALLDAGAADAWLTPILMKKGRPAHTVRALVEPARLPAVGAALLAHTSTIGYRTHPVSKYAAPRRTATVDVAGQPVRVQVATGADGSVLTATPEWEDVRAAAERTGLPARRVLALAQAAASAQLAGGSGAPPA